MGSASSSTPAATQTIAAVLERPDAPFVLEELELDAPRAGEVLIDIDVAGVCHSDLNVQDGLAPALLPGVLGHEGVGRVASVGPGIVGVSIGDRVALSFAACGACRQCQRAHPGTCRSFFALNVGGARADGTTALRRDGEPVSSHFFGQSSFATRAIALESTLVPLPSDVPDAVAAPLGCGVQTGVGAVLNVLRPEPGSSLVVLGAGSVGLAAVMAGVIAGCDPIVAVDRHADRLAIARDVGATEVILARDVDVGRAVAALTRGGAEHVLETTGAPSLIAGVIHLAAPGGTVGVIGAPPLGTRLEFEVASLLSFGRTLVGIMEGDAVPQEFVPRLVGYWRDGRLPVERLVETFDFDRINDAAAESRRGAVIKPVLCMR